MKLYYFANVKSPAQLLAYQEAVSMMKKADLQVFSNVASASDFELSEQDNLVQIDAVILDSSSSEAEVGYLLAVAISHKKPAIKLAGRAINPIKNRFFTSSPKACYLTIPSRP